MDKNEGQLEVLATAPVVSNPASAAEKMSLTTSDEATNVGNLRDTSALRARIRDLELVVELERRLRREQQANILKQTRSLGANDPQNFPHSAPVDDSDATVLAAVVHTPGAAQITQIQSAAAFGLTRNPIAEQSRASGSDDLALALPVAFRLHEYRIDSVLGQGGFGITYLATDVQLNTKVAIKEYLPSGLVFRDSDRSIKPRWTDDKEIYQFGLDSFLVEARTLATFRHNNIVRVARFFEANRTAYIVLEYERGEPLKSWWPKHASLPESELLELLRALVDGLGVVHDAGYLHRDIKPDNISLVSG